MRRFPHLQRAFTDSLESFGPNDFFVIQKGIKDCAQPPLRLITSLLRLSDCDTEVFHKFRDAILQQAPTCGPRLRADLCRCMGRLWENHFELDMEKDIAFEIGRFYYGVRDYARALKFYRLSLEQVGEHHVTHHNVGLCLYSLSRFEEAIVAFEKGIAYNPAYEKSRTWLARCRAEMEARSKRAAEATTPSALSPAEVVLESSSGDGERMIINGVETLGLGEEGEAGANISGEEAGVAVATAVGAAEADVAVTLTSA